MSDPLKDLPLPPEMSTLIVKWLVGALVSLATVGILYWVNAVFTELHENKLEISKLAETLSTKVDELRRDGYQSSLTRGQELNALKATVDTLQARSDALERKLDSLTDLIANRKG